MTQPEKPILNALLAASESFAGEPTQPQHTPGPWRFQDDSFQNGGHSFKVAADHGNGSSSTVATVHIFHHPYTGEEAVNARLIAEAPELLRLVKWAADIIPLGPDNPLTKAIAKAEGRAQ